MEMMTKQLTSTMTKINIHCNCPLLPLIIFLFARKASIFSLYSNNNEYSSDLIEARLITTELWEYPMNHS